MRRTARLLTGTALAVATAGLATAPAHGGGVPAAARLRGAPAAAGTGSLQVSPATAVPGGRITVNTTECGARGTAIADAGSVGAGTFMLAPGTNEGEAVGEFRVPTGAQPGTYEIVAKCAEGDRQVTGDLVVALSTARMGAAHEQVRPRGSVKTGVGGALGTDPVQTAAGVAALAVAAAGGTWLLHRRARGDGI
ncbi:hypothetical protein [Streptomyces cellostaticus]|uniref:hypothetical protein n=1 Tax=Streptomyces TaxID=1883 RepID=UPI0020273AA5|nr:hypothetical protein [Streptomyces cellostaticus]